MRAKRWIATFVLTAALTTAALPAPSQARDFHPAQGAADDFGNSVAIGLGITTGVLVLVGGALWYYFHHRHADEAASASLSDAAPSRTGGD